MALVRKIYWFLFVYDLNDEYAVQRSFHGEPWKNKLKRDLTGLVLVSYVIFVFNPLIPIFGDLMAHTFWEKEHLQTEHKLQGNNHLYKELSKPAKQTDKDKSANNPKSASYEFVHMISKSSYNFSNNFSVRKPAYISIKQHYPVSYMENDYPPPQA